MTVRLRRAIVHRGNQVQCTGMDISNTLTDHGTHGGGPDRAGATRTCFASSSLIGLLDGNAGAGWRASLFGAAAEGPLERVPLLVYVFRLAARAQLDESLVGHRRGRLVLRRALVHGPACGSARPGLVERQHVENALEAGGEQQEHGANDEHNGGREVLYEDHDDQQVQRAAEQVHQRGARCEQ